jgi:hypothetical protein
MGILQEIWVRDIQEVLYEGNEMLQRSIDHSGFISGSVVHIPNSGANPGSEINRSSFPATITERNDVDRTYNVNSFTTDPIRVRNFQEIQTSYAKRSSVMSQHIETLKEDIGFNTLYNWGVDATEIAGRIVTTTGAATAALPNGTATGTRNLLTMDDIRSAAAKLDKDNMPKAGRVMTMPVDMYYELVGVDSVAFANRFGGATQQTGVVDKLYGFDIYMKPTVNTYVGTANTIKAVGAAEAIADCNGVLFWSVGAVALADGAANLYSDAGDGGNGSPTNYGVVISAEQLMGSKALRSDLKGVGAIVQGYTAA